MTESKFFHTIMQGLEMKLVLQYLNFAVFRNTCFATSHD